MKKAIVLVTANVGAIDPPLGLPGHDGVDAIYYTDDERAAPAVGWDLVVPVAAGRGPSSSGRMEAKRYKLQLHRLDEVAGGDYRYLAWADACFEFASLDFLREWAELIGGDPARGVFVPHPDRNTVAEEYDYLERQLAQGNKYLTRRYEPEPLRRERAYFGRVHDLEALPLWAGGIWMLPNTRCARTFLDSWWATVQAYSVFDQAALSPLLAEHGITVEPCRVNLYRNPWWARRAHP